MLQYPIMADQYIPSRTLLKKYADVLINFALGSGKGVQAGEVVEILVPDVAKPLALELQNATLKAGGHPLMRMYPTGLDKDFYNLANDDQLTFFPKEYLKAKADLISHRVDIVADHDPRELQFIDPSKMMKTRSVRKQYRDWLTEKELNGKFTWTIAIWGMQPLADEVGLSLKEYWRQIARGCFLDKANPIQEWRDVFGLQKDILKKLNALKIDHVHMEGPDVDLIIKLGEDRVWHGGSGRNIPSFECFTSPDWRGTNGWIKFNQPLYRYGNVLKDIRLEFKNGIITKSQARVGGKFLKEMLKTPNADKLGEYSLTDKRLSRITHVMGETLFDENIGGPHGNTHVAVGMAYKDCYRGDASKLSKEDWEARGYNDSAEHTDIISTTKRTVTATLTDGTEMVIYKNGMFTL